MNTATVEAMQDMPLFVLTTIEIPPLGARWPGLGGTFEALMKGDPGQADYLLILHEQHADDSNWKAQTEWAAGVEVDNHKDFTLPTLRELNALRANAKDKFNDDVYWSCEPYGSDYAWYQFFGIGIQYVTRQGYLFRACAVRRVPIR
jgi:hypothetical protein